MTRPAFALLLAMMVSSSALARPQASDVLGRYWLPGRVGQMEIFERDEQYFGRVVSVEDPGVRDRSHPDPALQNRPVVGLEVLSGFRYDRRRWVGGTVYDPRTGHSHQASLWFEPGDSGTLWARSPRGPNGPGWKRRFERVRPSE